MTMSMQYGDSNWHSPYDLVALSAKVDYPSLSLMKDRNLLAPLSVFKYISLRALFLPHFPEL